jgi:hypothetical protein
LTCLQVHVEAELGGDDDAPYDNFVRWKPLAEKRVAREKA